MQFRKMPHEIMERSDLTKSAKFVFCYLLDLQSTKSSSWPGMTRIGTATQYARSTVKRAVILLIEKGLIVKKNRRHGQSNLYRIQWQNTGQNEPSSDCGRNVNTGQNEPTVGQNDPRTRVKMNPYSDSDLIIKQQTKVRCAPKTGQKKRPVRDPWKELKSHWPKGSPLSESDPLREAWIDHWAARKKKLSAAGVELVAKRFEGWGLADTLEAIRCSIENGYTGIKLEWAKDQPVGSKPKRRPGDYVSGKVKSWDRTVNK